MPRGTPFRSEVLAVPQTGFVAAAKNYTIGKANRNWSGKNGKAAGEAWQNAAWDFYDTIGEYRYGVDWVGNLLSKATLYVVGPDGQPSQHDLVTEAMAALFGGPEGQAEMLRMLGIQFTVAGEAFIIGLDEDGDDDWFVIAATEITRKGDTTFQIGTGSDKIEADTADSMVIRIWRPHPRKPKISTSPSRAVLPILSEIERLTMHVAAQLESRLTSAGLLILPSQFSFPTLPSRKLNPGDPDAEPVATQVANPAQAFADLLVEIASIAIDDPSDASAKVPIVTQVDGEYIDKVQFLKFWTDLDAHAIELRQEAIRRLALGLDMPPEVLTGTADTNHWAAWQIDEAAIKSHSEPLLKVITSSLTVGYLRPVLLGLGMSEDEVEDYAIAADTADLRLRPNRSKEAMELYDRGVLSKEAVVRENGFDETDVMGEKERTEWLTVKLAEGQTTPELVAQGLALLGVPVAAPVEHAEETHEDRPTPSILNHPTRGAPNDGEVPDELVAGSEILVFRALERAGNRLKNRVNGHIPPKTSAAELYLRMPALSEAEITAVLDDAWACTGQFDLPSDTDTLNRALDGYTRTLLTLRKRPDRQLLREHLALMRLEYPASI
jgi:hypothetical protein